MIILEQKRMIFKVQNYEALPQLRQTVIYLPHKKYNRMISWKSTF